MLISGQIGLRLALNTSGSLEAIRKTSVFHASSGRWAEGPISPFFDETTSNRYSAFLTGADKHFTLALFLESPCLLEAANIDRREQAPILQPGWRISKMRFSNYRLSLLS